MGTTKHIGRVGALAVALGVGLAGAPVSAASDGPPTTALIACGTTCPTPDDYVVNAVGTNFIEPTHPGDIDYVKVTTPEELWPVTGVARLLGLAVGPQSLFGVGGPAWPDEPLWKLSGLFDLTGNQSLQTGVADLEGAIAENPSDHLVIFGWSQGAGVANVVKRRLADQYPNGTDAPDIDFVLVGDPNLPNGGLMSRFAGLYIPILDFPFNGPAATDTQFDTVEIYGQYDGFADFPLYPLNFIADVNAILGMAYVHMYMLDVSLADDAATAPVVSTDPTGKTTYYFFENENLPLFGPLRTIGVPEPVIDVFEPFFKVIVDQGYDRSIKPWEPTPARLIPPLRPAKVAADLVNAIGEGIDNAAALVQPQTSLKVAAKSENSDADQARHDVESQTNETIGAMKSIVKGLTTVRSPAITDDATRASISTRRTPVRDAIRDVRSDVRKVVDKVAGDVKKALGVDRDKPKPGPDKEADADAVP